MRPGRDNARQGWRAGAILAPSTPCLLAGEPGHELPPRRRKFVAPSGTPCAKVCVRQPRDAFRDGVQVVPANPLRPPGRSAGIPRQHAQQRPTHPRGKAALAATAENVGTDAIVLPGLAWRVACAECVLEGPTPEEHDGIIREESRSLADAIGALCWPHGSGKGLHPRPRLPVGASMPTRPPSW